MDAKFKTVDLAEENILRRPRLLLNSYINIWRDWKFRVLLG